MFHDGVLDQNPLRIALRTYIESQTWSNPVTGWARATRFFSAYPQYQPEEKHEIAGSIIAAKIAFIEANHTSTDQGIIDQVQAAMRTLNNIPGQQHLVTDNILSILIQTMRKCRVFMDEAGKIQGVLFENDLELASDTLAPQGLVSIRSAVRKIVIRDDGARLYYKDHMVIGEGIYPYPEIIEYPGLGSFKVFLNKEHTPVMLTGGAQAIIHAQANETIPGIREAALKTIKSMPLAEQLKGHINDKTFEWEGKGASIIAGAHNELTGVVIKFGKRSFPASDEDYSWNSDGYYIAKNMLGGLAAPVLTLGNANFSFRRSNGNVNNRKAAPVYVQQKCSSLGEYIQKIMDGTISLDPQYPTRLDQAKATLDQFAEIVYEMTKRGVRNTDPKQLAFINNFGVLDDGRVVLIDTNMLAIYKREYPKETYGSFKAEVLLKLRAEINHMETFERMRIYENISDVLSEDIRDYLRGKVDELELRMPERTRCMGIDEVITSEGSPFDIY